MCPSRTWGTIDHMNQNDDARENSFGVLKRIGPILAAFLVLIGVAAASAALTRDETPPAVEQVDQEVDLQIGKTEKTEKPGEERVTTSKEPEASRSSSAENETRSRQSSQQEPAQSLAPQRAPAYSPAPQVAPVQPRYSDTGTQPWYDDDDLDDGEWDNDDWDDGADDWDDD